MKAHTQAHNSIFYAPTLSAYFRDALRSYQIFIDGVECGDISRGETKEFAVDNGHHIVRAKIDWCGSNELCVDVNDSIVELEVGSSLEGWRILFMEYYMSFGKNKYLRLRKKGDGPV